MVNLKAGVTFDKRKFVELVLHITTQYKGDHAFGVVKLNKLLFFSDYIAYAELGEAITGADYIKLKYGPAPKSMYAIRDEMKERGEIDVERTSHYSYPLDRIIPRREPDLSLFSDKELALVDMVIESFSDDNATDLSNLTHRFPGWQVAATYEVIPYEAMFLSNERATEEDKQWAIEAVATHGW